MERRFRLHHVAGCGDLRAVEHLLGSGADVNEFDPRGLTPLIYAVSSAAASPALVRLLIQIGARVDLQCARGIYPANALEACLVDGDAAKLAVLVKHGADVTYRTKDGYDALIHASSNRGPELLRLLRFLVSRRVELNSITTYEESASRILSRVVLMACVFYWKPAPILRTYVGRR